MASISAELGTPAATSSRYQALLVGLLGVNIGIVFLDRTAFGLLAPMIQPEFHLTNTDIGLVNVRSRPRTRSARSRRSCAATPACHAPPT